MDLTALHKGVMTVASLVASVTFSTGTTEPVTQADLYHPEIISSFNIQTESPETDPLQNLNALASPGTDQIKLVTEAKAAEIVTVEQPPIVYSVIEPTPKPSPTAKPSEKPEESNKTENPTEKPTTDKPDSENGKLKKENSENGEPKPSASPSSTPALTSSNADILFQMTNDYRAKMGKPAFEKEERLCKIAEARAPQVKSELASGTLHKGFKELNLPYWATENIAAYSTMQENFNFLSTDYIHKKAIESDAKYSCTACTGTSCSQIFSSFTPK